MALRISAIGTVVGIGVAVLASGGGQGELLGLAGLVLLISGLLGVRVRMRGLDWLAPPMLLTVVVGLYYVARPLGLLGGLLPLAGTNADMGAALALVYVMVVSFWIGYGLPVGEAISVSAPWLAGRWSARRLRLAIWGWWGVGLLCWAAMIYKSGGVLVRLTMYGGGSAAGLGVLVVASAALLGAALVVGWLGYLKGLIGRGELAVLAVGCAGPLALHGQRAALLVPLIMAAAIYHYVVRRLRAREIMLAGLVGVVLVVVLGLPRLRFMRTEGLTVRAADYARIGGWLVIRNLTAFDALMLAVGKVPRETGYQWGRSYVDAVAMLVPRQIYKDKPRRNLFNRLLRKEQAGSMAMSLPGEGYLNFGLSGLVLEAVLLGIIYRALYAYRGRHRDSEAAILAYAIGVAFFGLICRGGLLGGHLGLLGAYMILLLAATVGCGGVWRHTTGTDRQGGQT